MQKSYWNYFYRMIRKIRSFDFNITKVRNKFYGIDHITANFLHYFKYN